MERNSCSCARRNRRYGVLSSLNFRGSNCSACSNNCGCGCASSDCPCCTTCSGSSLFYSGACGATSNGCCNSCNNCNNCCDSCGGTVYGSRNSCGCNSCNSCSSCCDSSAYSGCNSCGCDSCGSAVYNSCGCNNGSVYSSCGCDSCCDTTLYRQSDFNRSGCSSCSCDSCAAHAVFTTSCAISVDDGENIPLDMDSGDTAFFRESGGRITFLRSGTYDVTYSLNVPTGVSACTNLALHLDGDRVFHSAASVDTDGSKHNLRYTGHGVLNVRRGQRIELVAENGLEIPGASGKAPTAQLTIVRVG